MTIPSQQAQRQQYLQAIETERQKKKQEAQQQAEESWEQYQAPLERPNIKEILAGWWKTTEAEQKRLSQLYNKMYLLYKRNNNEMNVNQIYQDIWYDTMSNKEKQIVDYFLWGRQIKKQDKVDNDSPINI